MRRITGSRDYVTARLWEAQQSGQDLTMYSPRILADGTWEVYVTPGRAPAPPPPPAARAPRARPARRRVSTGRWVGAVIVLAAAGITLGVAVWLVATWLIDHWAHILGALVILALAAAALARAGAGGAGHCSGPNSGH